LNLPGFFGNVAEPRDDFFRCVLTAFDMIVNERPRFVTRITVEPTCVRDFWRD